MGIFLLDAGPSSNSQHVPQGDSEDDEDRRESTSPSVEYATQSVDSDFIDRVNCFIDRYRSALESLAQR